MMESYEEQLLPYDPELPHLQLLLDRERIAHLLQHQFQAGLADTSPELTGIEIERITYHRKNNCRVLYRIFMHTRGDQEQQEEWLCAQMFAPRYAKKRFSRLWEQLANCPRPVGALSGLPSVLSMPEYDLLFWIFPADPKLQTLQQVTQSEFIGKHVSTLYKRRISSNEYVMKKIKYMPLKRCVLRLQFLSDREQNGSVVLYSKTYNDGKSGHHYTMLKRAYEELTRRQGAVAIPRPVHFFEGLHTFWQEAWTGAPLLDRINHSNVEGLLEAAGEMVARMHSIPMTGLPAAPEIEEILATAREDGLQFVHVLPHYRQVILPMLHELEAESQKWLDQKDFAVPLHGACRIEQMLVCDDELALIDFDAFSVGDPHAEVGEFLASLLHLRLTANWTFNSIDQGGSAFLKGYSKYCPFTLDQKRLLWYIRTFMISKIFSAVKHLDVAALSRFQSENEHILYFWDRRL